MKNSELINPQRVYWQRPFKKSEALYLLDGAIVSYPADGGILYEHHLIQDNMCVIEKPMTQFYRLPIGERLQLSLDAEDDGLFSFPEIKFFKARELIASFYDLNSKTVSCQIPDYDDFQVRVHVRGEGCTLLKSVSARVTSLDGLVLAGDETLSERIGAVKMAGSADSLLATFSPDDHYLAAEFATDERPQIHFAKLDNREFDSQIILSALADCSAKTLRLYQCPADILQTLQASENFDRIELI